MRSIQKSIFTVCLDAPVPRVSEDVYRSRVAGQMLHGGGSKINSGNRWFDKTLQVRTRLGHDSHPRHTPKFSPLQPRDFLPLHLGVPASQLVKLVGSQQVNAAVITRPSACHYWAWPRNCCHPQLTPAARQREPAMWARQSSAISAMTFRLCICEMGWW